MNIRLVPASLFILLACNQSYSQNLNTYVTEWSGYNGYPFDGSHPSIYHGRSGSSDETASLAVVSNPDMVEKSKKSTVVLLAFFQAWNQDLVKQYNLPQNYIGTIHFGDLWSDFPSPADKVNYPTWLAACKQMTPGICSTIQKTYTGESKYFDIAQGDDIGQMNNFNAFLNLPSEYRVISIGGANTKDNDSISTKTFQTIFASSENEKNFLTSLSSLMTNVPASVKGLNGVDYDFEPPIDASGAQKDPDATTTADYKNLFDLIKATRDRLGPTAYISVTLTPNQAYLDVINSSIADGWFKQVAQYVNAINIMTYDMHGPWASSADPGAISHEMLRHPTEMLHNTYAVNYGIEEVMNKILNFGVNPAKLQVGLAAYGRGFAGVEAGDDQKNPGFDQPWTGPSIIGSEPSGYLSYKKVGGLLTQGYTAYDITDPNDGTTVIASYLYNSDPNVKTLVGYVSPHLTNSICGYIKNQKLAGAILWSMDADAKDDGSQGPSIISEYNKSCGAPS